MCMMVKGIEAPLNIIQGSPGRALPPRDVAAYGSTEDQRLQCFLASYQLPAFASCTDNFNGHLGEVSGASFGSSSHQFGWEPDFMKLLYCRIHRESPLLWLRHAVACGNQAY